VRDDDARQHGEGQEGADEKRRDAASRLSPEGRRKQTQVRPSALFPGGLSALAAPGRSAV
jgi:hypothetical protein